MTSDASDNCWIPIRYRGFYDVPLAIHVRWDDVDLLLDCPFDEALDEYSPEYRILHVSAPPPDEGAWGPIIDAGVEVGRIPVAWVRLDESRRRFIDRSSVETVLAALQLKLRTGGAAR
jgi:hypothetical protein